MSRSYKHTPYAGEKKHNKEIANRKFRRSYANLDITYSRSAYKKTFPQYDICDYGWVCTWEQHLLNAINYRYKKFTSIDDEYQWWYKNYKRK